MLNGVFIRRLPSLVFENGNGGLFDEAVFGVGVGHGKKVVIRY